MYSNTTLNYLKFRKLKFYCFQETKQMSQNQSAAIAEYDKTRDTKVSDSGPTQSAQNITLQQQQYIDPTWLSSFGLSVHNVLDYFYTSPFYLGPCNNEIIRQQGVGIGHLTNLTGLEYSLDLQACQEPHLYVIRKQIRRGRNSIELKDVFYCLDGVFYQSPTFENVLRSRIAKTSYYLMKSFQAVAAAREMTLSCAQVEPINTIAEKSGELEATGTKALQLPRAVNHFQYLQNGSSYSEFEA